MWLQLRFSDAFQHMLVPFAEIQPINLCDFLDLKLLNSCSNQEFNMLSKTIQKALHEDQRRRASLCYLWEEASSALALSPDILLRRAISFLLPRETPGKPLPATLESQSVPHGRYTTGQGRSIRSSNYPHGNNSKYFASTRQNTRWGAYNKIYYAVLKKKAII